MKRLLAFLTVVLVLSLAVALPILAQSGGGFDLLYTVDGGGCFSQGGGYSLGGTIGQPDAGVLTGGDYTLTSGFWAGEEGEMIYYLPLGMKNG